MSRDRRDLLPAWAKTGPLLAAGPWLRDVLMLNPPSRCCAADRAGRRAASARSARTAQPDHRSSRRTPTPSHSALVNIVGGTYACGVFSESGPERADCRKGSWIRKPEKWLHLARKPIDVAINSEASVIIFHDGWYYLLVTEGAGRAGANSSCNIRIGRSRKVTGPFVDNVGIEMLPDGGKLFGRPSGRPIGPDHFGLLDLGGVQRVSCHHEADLGRGAGSVLDIRSLL